MTSAPTMPAWASMIAPPSAVGAPKSLIIYGEPGTYKTSILGSAIKVPGFNRGVIIDVDNGTEVFSNDPEIFAAVQDGRIQIVPVDKRDPNAFLTINYLINDLVQNDYGYDFVGLDALDVAQEVMVDYLLANTVNEKGAQDTRKAWGEVSKTTSDWMWAFQNAPHFTGITVMHSRDGVDEDSKTYKVKPKLAGSVKDSIAGIPSLVAYVEHQKLEKNSKETHLVATLGASDVFSTKNRYSISEPIVDFDLPKLYERINARPTVTPVQAAQAA